MRTGPDKGREGSLLLFPAGLSVSFVKSGVGGRPLENLALSADDALLLCTFIGDGEREPRRLGFDFPLSL